MYILADETNVSNSESVVPHPCSQVHYQISSLTGIQELRDDACRQIDEVNHLVILQYSVVLHDLPYERRHKSHWRDKEL